MAGAGPESEIPGIIDGIAHVGPKIIARLGDHFPDRSMFTVDRAVRMPQGQGHQPNVEAKPGNRSRSGRGSRGPWVQ